MSWYVYKCRCCGHWQVKENRKDIKNLIFKCQRCNKGTKILKTYARGRGRNDLVNYGPIDNPATASLICKRVKLHEHTGDIEVKKFDLGFETYGTY